MPRAGLCYLLAFVFFFGPECFTQLAQADTLYANLTTCTWAKKDTAVHYLYDDNGSVEYKYTAAKGEANWQTTYTEKVQYTYNLAGRLESVTTDNDYASSTNTVSIAKYIYNDSGIRVRAYTYEQPQNGGTKSNEKTVVYLPDESNHTGYSQTLEELTFINNDDPEVGTDTPDSVRTYLIGDDVLAQSDASGTKWLLYDGHGSTRQLAGIDGTVSNSYSYDAYGVMLGGNPTSQPATNLLYSGEHYDTSLGQYYLRARMYDTLNGRFTSLDPYAGNNDDPQSLHKYLYCHANPINATDPSGLMDTLVGQLTLGDIISKLAAVALPHITTALLAVTTAAILLAIYELSRDYLAAGAAEIASMIRESAQTISRAIGQAARALKQAVKELLKQKPYFVLERFTPNIYKFTASCLTWNPGWYYLTWHGRRDLAAKNRALVLSKYGHLRKLGYNSIDEFPYASTIEGGAGAKGCAVPLRENLIQGGYLKVHYYGVLRKPMTKFLVIPVPK